MDISMTLRIWVDYIYCLDYSIHDSRLLLILNILIYMRNLTDYTWYLLLAQRPSTLILMMINSCSYRFTNNLVMFSFRYLTKILVGDSFNKGVLELSHGDSRARASKFISSIRWSQARWITFGSSRLEDGVRQEGFGLF